MIWLCTDTKYTGTKITEIGSACVSCQSLLVSDARLNAHPTPPLYYLLLTFMPVL